MTGAWVEVYESRFARVVKPSQRWRWRLIHSNGRKLASSGEGYHDKAECARMAGRVMGGDYAEAVARFS